MTHGRIIKAMLKAAGIEEVEVEQQEENRHAWAYRQAPDVFFSYWVIPMVMQ